MEAETLEGTPPPPPTVKESEEESDQRHSDSIEKKEEEEEEEEEENTASVTQTTERPSRERKIVERYSITSASRPNQKKTISIDKGRGTQLKDIPNVAFKLSKRKADDNLHLLHTILFGKKGKAQTLKRNIGRFSGFVWVKDEEKQRARVKEKLEKCVKDKLIDFCDVLNISINKAIARKEDLSAKLLDFLESPHSTTDVILSDKEQKGQKRKRNVNSSKPSSKEAFSDVPEKKQKKRSSSAKKQGKSAQSEEEDVNDESESDDSEDKTHAGDDVAFSKGELEDEKVQSGEEENQPIEHGSDKSASQNDMEIEESKGNNEVEAEVKVVPSKSSKNKSSSSSKKGNSNTSAAKSLSKSGEPTLKKRKYVKRNAKDEGASSKLNLSGKKQSNKSSTKAPVKDEGKSKKKAKAEPSREEMHAVVVDILKEVDFNTATLSDILKQLGTHFGLDLMHRKAELKDIITEVINSMTDDEDGEETTNNAEADKDEEGGGEGR